MARLQQHLMMLLEEFDALCADINVHYSLIDRTLLYAEQAKPLKGSEVDVVMCFSDFEKLRNYLSGIEKEGRAIESIDNNPLMPGWYYRYVDTSTTYLSFDYAHVRSFHGVGINIHIARNGRVTPRSLVLGFFERGMKSGIHFSYKRFQMERPYDPIAYAAVKASRLLLGERGFAYRVGRMFESDVLDNPTKESKLSMPETRTVKLPAGFLVSTDYATLGGARLEVSNESDEYLARRFGGASLSQLVPFIGGSMVNISRGDFNALFRRCRSFRKIVRLWQSANPPFRREDDSNLCNLDTSYLDLEEPITLFTRDRAFWKARSCWLRNRVFSFGWRHYLQKRRWDALYFVMDRYHQWELLAPCRYSLEKLSQTGCYDILSLFLKDYLALIKKHARKGYPLFLDEKLWTIAQDVFEKKNDPIASKMDALRKQNKLEPIEGPEANAYLIEHSLSEHDPIVRIANQSCKEWDADSSLILFVDRPNATGDTKAILQYCLSAKAFEGYSFAYTVSSINEVTEILSMADECINRVRFVIRGGFEFGRCLKSASIIFTTVTLNASFEKDEEQRVVFIPSPDLAWREGQNYRKLLRFLVQTTNKADLLVLPYEQVEKTVLSCRSNGCRSGATVLRCGYPRFRDMEYSQNNCESHDIVIGAMGRGQWGKWGSFEDVNEFARVAAAELDILSSDIRVRIPQAVFERFLRNGAPSDIVIPASQPLTDQFDSACLLITDSIEDCAIAHFSGFPSVLITKSESITELLNDLEDGRGIGQTSVVKNTQEAFALARELLKESNSNYVVKAGASSARDIAECSLRLLDERPCTESAPSQIPSDLLVLEWQDTDEFHGFLDRAGEIASTIVLIEEQPHWLLDSDIDALGKVCSCYIHRKFVQPDEDGYTEQKMSTEWKRALGDVQFGIALVPQMGSEKYTAFLENAPAMEVISYSNLSQIVELLD